MDEGLLGGLAEGIQSGLASYKDARRMKMDAEAQAKQAALQQRQLALSEAKDQMEFDPTAGKYGLSKQGLIEKQNAEYLKGLSSDYDIKRDPTGLITGAQQRFKQKTIDPMANELREQRLQDIKTRAEEKDMALQVPGVGKAMTPQDAKDLKEATRAKQNFDSKIDEMIALRKEFGGEVLNREAVERGKQLSNDLLLEYKNMAKLGVLSASDEKIINSIIPKDPLEFKLSGTGGDPILNRLAKFKEDANKDYQANLGLRLRPGQEQKGLLAKQAPTQEAPKSAKDLAAIEWATKNQNNPKAQEILKLHGIGEVKNAVAR